MREELWLPVNPRLVGKKLAAAVLITESFTSASWQDTSQKPATSHTAIGEKELATKRQSKVQEAEHPSEDSSRLPSPATVRLVK